MSDTPLLPVTASSSYPPSTSSSPGPTGATGGRLTALLAGLTGARPSSISPPPPVAPTLSSTPAVGVPVDPEKSEKGDPGVGEAMLPVHVHASDEASSGWRRKRRLMSLPVVVPFVFCLVYLFLALAGVGYVEPSAIGGDGRAAPPLQLPESWSAELSKHQREQAYAQAMGLSKGSSLDELKQLSG